MYENSGKRESGLRLLEEIEVYNKGKGNLLDVGCGTGFFLKIAKEENWNVTGVEISEYAATYARERLKLKIEVGDFLEISLKESFFDVITMCSYIEHVRYSLVNIKKARVLLKENGLLVIVTGDIGSMFAKLSKSRWYLMTPPSHLYFFSRETIGKMLGKAGFEIIKITKYTRIMSLNYAFQRLHYLYHKNNFLGFICRKTENNLLGKVKIKVDLGDVMLVYAVKKDAEQLKSPGLL